MNGHQDGGGQRGSRGSGACGQHSGKGSSWHGGRPAWWKMVSLSLLSPADCPACLPPAGLQVQGGPLQGSTPWTGTCSHGHGGRSALPLAPQLRPTPTAPRRVFPGQ